MGMSAKPPKQPRKGLLSWFTKRLIVPDAPTYVPPSERAKDRFVKGEIDIVELHKQIELALQFEDSMDESSPDWRTWAATDQFDSWADAMRRREEVERQIVETKRYYEQKIDYAKTRRMIEIVDQDMSPRDRVYEGKFEDELAWW